MRLCILVPSEDYLGQAGVRIRYQRIEPALRALGHDVVLEVIDQYRSLRQFSHDVYLFSKCYDTRSTLIATLLRGSGRLVGVDLFDDYFSQTGDPRFVCHRDWLSAMGKVSDFFMCSTPRMLSVGQAFMPGVPGHVLNDPYEEADPQLIADTVERNRQAALSRRCIGAVWFGVGDNPHFAVGLRDLHAFGHGLAALATNGFDVNLRILTNRRALTAGGLELLRRLPVHWQLDEWSIQAEREVLTTSVVAFIPVNAQPFSIAKSLNRAVSALTAGTQVLSNGFPLYEPLSDFVYDNPADIVADLESDALKLRRATVQPFAELMSRLADPARETQQLASFLTTVLERKRTHEPWQEASAVPPGLVGVIHGLRSLGVVHQATQRLRQLSIGTPYSVETLNYDLRPVLTETGDVLVQLSDTAFNLLDKKCQRGWTDGTAVAGRLQRLQPLRHTCPALVSRMKARFAERSRAERLLGYEALMRDMTEIAHTLFPGIELLLSEGEAPFHATAFGAPRSDATELRA